MRNPIRGETDAFHLALGGAGLTGAALLIGASFGTGIVARLRDELDICVTHVIVERGAQAARQSADHAAATA